LKKAYRIVREAGGVCIADDLLLKAAYTLGATTEDVAVALREPRANYIIEDGSEEGAD
jgi:hypothetical protein